MLLHVGMVQHNKVGSAMFLHHTSQGKRPLPGSNQQRHVHLITVPLQHRQAIVAMGNPEHNKTLMGVYINEVNCWPSHLLDC